MGPKVYSSGVFDKYGYILMQSVPAGKVDGLNSEMIIEMFKWMLENEYYHRDLHFDNIYIEGEKMKVIDQGIVERGTDGDGRDGFNDEMNMVKRQLREDKALAKYQASSIADELVQWMRKHKFRVDEDELNYGEAPSPQAPPPQAPSPQAPSPQAPSPQAPSPLPRQLDFNNAL